MNPSPTPTFLLCLLAACGGQPVTGEGVVEEISWVGADERDDGPPHAAWDMVAQLREDLAAERHPSDGGGRAFLEGEGSDATAGRSGRWTLIYEVGSQGVAVGGTIALQVSPFWGWSTPQVEWPQSAGYTEVEWIKDADGLDPPGLEAATWGDQLLGISVQGRALREGERIRIRYGAGDAGAMADRYSERGERLWITVDGDGDGVRAVLEDSPSIDVKPGPAAGLVLSLPGTSRPGQRGRLTIATVDGRGNASAALDGEIALQVVPAGLDLREQVILHASAGSRTTVDFVAEREGLYRVRALGPDGLVGQSNPLLVSSVVPQVLWGDVHGHSNLTDGTGTPSDYYAYARDVAGLDFAALTDHDHWGMLFLDQHPELWNQILDANHTYHQPGRFLTIHAYEWTSWIHGHRHVLFFGGEAQVFSSMDPRYESPVGLWQALQGQPALTIAHHSGGGPIPTNWSIPPDPVLEPIVEVSSVHGVSEALDAPGVIYSPVPGAFVRDALDAGHDLGFISSGDSHDGHPGLAHLAASQGGLVAVLDAEPTRLGLLEAFRQRRVYATNGPRILLFTTIATKPMGSTLAPMDKATLTFLVVGDAPLASVELIRSGEVVQRLAANGEPLMQGGLEIEDLEAGEYLYLRVAQQNRGLAFSSPFFVEREPATMDVPKLSTE